MDWPKVPLSRLVRIAGGGTPSKSQADFWLGDIPWVSPKDMNGNEIADTADHISAAAVEQSATQVVPTGSVLAVVRSGILAHKFPVAVARRPVALNQDIKALVPRECVLSKYLLYALEAAAGVILTHCVKFGATVHSVDVGKLKSLEIRLPPLSEQRRIVEILDQADRLRRLRAEADAKADRILPALFVKMFGDPETNPMRWEVKALGDLVTELRYGTSIRCHSEPNGLPVLRIPNVVRGEVDTTDLKYCELPEKDLKHLIVHNDDVLFVRTNGNPDYVGRCAVFEEAEPFSFASYLIRARLNRDLVAPRFVAAFLQTPQGRNAMVPFIRTTAGQSNVNTAGLRQVPIPMPPLDLQARFHGKLDDLKKLNDRRERLSVRLSDLFDGLLHRAFQGSLTASWREAYKEELLQEIAQQSEAIAGVAP